MKAARAITGAWQRFWFRPQASEGLAATRILVAAHALWVLMSRDFAGVAGIPEPFWRGVRASAQWRFLIFPGHGEVELVLVVGAAVALLGVALGLQTRVLGIVAAILLYHLSPLGGFLTSTNPINRGFTLAIPSLLILAAAPSDVRWSVRGLGRTGSPPTPSPDFGWPVRLIQLFVAQVYLFGVIGKLTDGGIEWFSVSNMRRQFVYAYHAAPGMAYSDLGVLLAGSPILTRLAVVGVVVVELGFVLALFSKRARSMLVPAALLMHVVILLTMRLVYILVPYLLVFVDWHKVSLLFGAIRARFGAARAEVPT